MHCGICEMGLLLVESLYRIWTWPLLCLQMPYNLIVSSHLQVHCWWERDVFVTDSSAANHFVYIFVVLTSKMSDKISGDIWTPETYNKAPETRRAAPFWHFMRITLVHSFIKWHHQYDWIAYSIYFLCIAHATSFVMAETVTGQSRCLNCKDGKRKFDQQYSYYMYFNWWIVSQISTVVIRLAISAKSC